MDHGFMQSTSSIAFQESRQKTLTQQPSEQTHLGASWRQGPWFAGPRDASVSRVISPSAVLSGPDGSWRWG